MLRVVLASALLSSPALASHYQAELVQAPSDARIVVRDQLWTCGGGSCSAGKSNSRPAIVCAALVKEVGPLTRFTVAGQAFPPAALEKCNARADR